MNEYELLYVITPRLSAEEVDEQVTRTQERVTSVGGEVLETDNWGRRRLAYPIQHHLEGTYVLSYVKLPADQIADFERALHLDPNVLRHLLIKGIIPGYEGPPEQELVSRGGSRGGYGGRDSRRDDDRPPRQERSDETEGAADRSGGDAEPASNETAPAPAEASDAPAAAEAEPAAAPAE